MLECLPQSYSLLLQITMMISLRAPFGSLLALAAAVSLALLPSPCQGVIQPNGDCNLVSFLPFEYTPTQGPFQGTTNSPYSMWPKDTIQKLGVDFAAAQLLAIDHFNHRDTSIVSELAQLTDCPVTFPSLQIFNSAQKVTNIFKYLPRIDTNQTCAILGPLNPELTSLTSAFSETYDLLNVIYGRTPAFVKVQPNEINVGLHAGGLAGSIGSYLEHTNRTYVGIIWDGVPHTGGIVTALQDSGPFSNGLILHRSDLSPESTRFRGQPGSPTTVLDDRRRVIHEIRDTGYKTVYLAISDPTKLAELAVALDEEGLLDDHIYVLDEVLVRGDVGRIFGTSVAAGSPLDRLLSGAVVIARLDGFSANPEPDRFLKVWKQLNASFVERVNALIPEKARVNADYFETAQPSLFSSFAFDAVITLGAAACGGVVSSNAPPSNGTPGSGASGLSAALSEPTQIPQTNVTTPQRPTSGAELRQAVPKVTFQGASGWFLSGKGPRTPRGIVPGAYNIRPVMEKTGNRTYRAVLVATRHDFEWQLVPGEVFVYRDGSSLAPRDNREIFNENFLSGWVRVLGLLLLGVAWLLAIGSLVIVLWWRDTPQVRLGQPPFLAMMCIGSILTSASIFTLSFDENLGWTDGQLDIACMLVPWFFFLGHILTFSALFASLWRVDRIFQFRRRKVTVAHAMYPPAAVLIVTVGILLLWTLLDPWTWKRDIFEDTLPAESYGECVSDNLWAFFGPLMGLMIFVHALTAYMAYKTQDLPPDLQYSNMAVYALVMHLQAWFIGVPILAVLGNTNADGTYLGRVLLIWIFSVATVSMVVVPRLTDVVRTRLPESARAAQRSSVNVSGASRVHVTGLESQLSSTVPKQCSLSSESRAGSSRAIALDET